MLAALSRSSRSSSMNSVRSNSNNRERPVPIEVDVIENVLDQNEMRSEFGDETSLHESDYDSINEDRNVAFMKKHPMGQILLSLLKDTFNLSKKTRNKEMETDFDDVCVNFYKAMELMEKNTKRHIHEANKNFERYLIEKELNSHLINENSDPPKRFSPVPTLTNSQQRSEAMRCFPTRSPKFSGTSSREGGTDVLEFISALNTAQEYCNLSEKEFKQFLLLCTTGRAHILLMEWIRLGETIPTIYHSLITHFDKRMTATAAQDLLFTYKAPKYSTLREVETNIMLWAGRAAMSLPDGPARNAFYNMQIVQALIRSLPPVSSSRVQSVYNTLSARLGRAALATELSRALNLDRHTIDLDIKQNGVERNFITSDRTHSKRKGFRNTGPPSAGTRTTHTYTSYNIGANISTKVPQSADRSCSNNTSYKNNMGSLHRTQNTDRIPLGSQHNHMGTSQRQSYGQNQSHGQSHSQNIGHSQSQSQSSFRSRRRPYQSQSRYTYMNNQSRSNNYDRYRSGQVSKSHYCSLCGKIDHLASNGCPYMVSDSGVTLGIMPSHSLCEACPSHVNPRLNHPSAVCPYRKGGPFYSS